MTSSARLAAATRVLGTVLLATAILGCGSASPLGTPASSASQSPEPASPSAGLCGVFTPAELTPFLGAEPGPGSSGGPLASACDWDAGDPFVMIQKVPPGFFEDLQGAPGYRQLEGIGDYGFVAAHAFGRIVSARTAEAAYVVIANEGTDEASQIEVLRTFIERSPGAPVLEAPGS